MKTPHLLLALVVSGPTCALAACGAPDGTYAVLVNAYPAAPGEKDAGDEADAGNGSVKQTVVYRGFWLVTSFSSPVGAGEASAKERAVTNETGIAAANGDDTAFVVVAKDWAPASGAAPTELLPMRSHAPLYVATGDTLRIVVSPESFDGDCSRGTPLSQSDADRITRDIFPAEFAGFRYDAATCTLTTIAEAGAEAGPGDAGGG